MQLPRKSASGEDNRVSCAGSAGFLLLLFPREIASVETRLLILNADPVFQDRALSIVDMFNQVESRIIRSLAEAISVLLDENFDGLMVEGEAALALDQATNVRQHFPSLGILCLVPPRYGSEIDASAEKQKITLISSSRSCRSLQRELEKFVASLEAQSSPAWDAAPLCAR